MKALVVQHTNTEGPGLLQSLLLEKGWVLDIRCVERKEDILPHSLHGFDSMLIMGGPMGANEEDKYPHLLLVQELIREAASNHIPTLGICLGAQLIARALGARVTRNPVKEIGWYEISVTDSGTKSILFAGLPRKLTFFQWHQDTFALPEKAYALAQGKTCLNQAFSIDNCIWALQFHPEVTPLIIKEWIEQWPEEIEEFGGHSEGRWLLEKTNMNWRQSTSVRGTFLNNIEKTLRRN